MGDRDIVNEVEESGTDNAAMVRRLNRVLAIQQKVSARFNAIILVSFNPGPPEGPGICDQIITEAQNSITLAQSLKRKFGLVG